jgi:hypothetical protein
MLFFEALFDLFSKEFLFKERTGAERVRKKPYQISNLNLQLNNCPSGTFSANKIELIE